MTPIKDTAEELHGWTTDYIYILCNRQYILVDCTLYYYFLVACTCSSICWLAGSSNNNIIVVIFD